MRTAAAPGLFVLFLEFDGCLHRYGTYVTEAGPVSRGPKDVVFFEYAPILHSVIARHPSIRIVLTTHWVEHFGYALAKRQLPSSLLQGRVVGSVVESTPFPRLRGMTRGREIREFAERHRIAQWIAIDVRDDGFADMRDRLVLCDERRGIRASKVLAELECKLSTLDAVRPPAEEARDNQVKAHRGRVCIPAIGRIPAAPFPCSRM
ncbi:hypothetical protein BN2475_580045 [Paraburkholderia ribeironis]|uniref:Uncharacterized protein n=1 Tax=Paraburkholderia ribeironis TaxID=1247936 RepID=A0A1N7SFE4_9BURK|nr:HAD domain-containing protein [Paraburkholderia ribeironis]SIT45679.1 hypothetical protein BN2475_580045 [Paraburkholderia ribeironis]